MNCLHIIQHFFLILALFHELFTYNTALFLILALLLKLLILVKVVFLILALLHELQHY